MMKQAFVLFALVGLAFSAPQPRKLFHEHFEDFMDVIIEEAGHEIQHLMEHYLEYEEFSSSLLYLQTTNFKDLINEMESLPEFLAVVEFLENDNIDIHFFIDMINQAIDNYRAKKVQGRHHTSGTDMSSFVEDSIALFPKEKLAALFDEKMENDEEFSTAIMNLKSEEWFKVFDALWQSETFLKEVQTLGDNGIDIRSLVNEIVAVFGQN